MFNFNVFPCLHSILPTAFDRKQSTRFYPSPNDKSHVISLNNYPITL